MASKTQLFNFADMTGGLNRRANPFQLAPNESPDLLNVDLDPRGGFRLRKGVDVVGDRFEDGGGSPLNPHSIAAFETTTAIKQVVVGVDTALYYSTGGNFSAISGITRSDARSNRMASYKDTLYIQNGTDACYKWDGTTATALTTTYNENFESPSGGDMPKAALICAFQNHVFIADTKEGSDRFANRVRFSHPNQPEDWRSVDYFDVDTGLDGDSITALVPDGERLLVFKSKSVHAIYGYDYTTFNVQALSHDIGTIRQESVVATEAGVYFFSWPNGVFRLKGNSIDNQFQNLFPYIEDGTITGTAQQFITLGWGRRRLWVNCPIANLTFVLDPSLSKEGSWTRYDIPAGPFLEWKPSDGATRFLACGSAGYVIELETDNSFDVWIDPDAPQHIESYYKTPWFFLKQPAVKKRWKRAEIVLRSTDPAVVTAEVYKDFDNTNTIRSYFLTVDGVTGATLYGSGAKYGEGVLYSSGVDVTNEIEKGKSMGTAKAVAIKFSGPPTNSEWGVDSVSLKYIPKAVK